MCNLDTGRQERGGCEDESGRCQREGRQSVLSLAQHRESALLHRVQFSDQALPVPSLPPSFPSPLSSFTIFSFPFDYESLVKPAADPDDPFKLIMMQTVRKKKT